MSDPTPTTRRARHKTHGPALTAPVVKFCLALLSGRSRCEAYTSAFPARDTPHATEMAAYRLVRKREVREFLRDLQACAADAARVDATRVVQALARIAFFDVRDVFDDRGRIKLPSEWSDATAGGILAVKSEELFETRSECDPETKRTVRRKVLVGYGREIKRVNPTEALKLLAQIRHLLGPDADPAKAAADRTNSTVIEIELGPDVVAPPVPVPVPVPPAGG